MTTKHPMVISVLKSHYESHESKGLSLVVDTVYSCDRNRMHGCILYIKNTTLRRQVFIKNQRKKGKEEALKRCFSTLALLLYLITHNIRIRQTIKQQTVYIKITPADGEYKIHQPLGIFI